MVSNINEDKVINMLGQINGKAVYNQTADLTEIKTETSQGISDVKDTLRFLLHKEIETEKEIFMLKEKTAHLDDNEGLK